MLSISYIKNYALIVISILNVSYAKTQIALPTSYISTEWAVNDEEKRTIYSIGETIYDFAEGSQPDSLWFEAKRTILGFGGIKIAQQVSGEWSPLWETTLKTTYTAYGGLKIDEKATAIKFYTESGATLNKNIINVRVNNRWSQEILWEQRLHNIVLGDTLILTAYISGGLSVSYESSKPEICELQGDTLIARSTGRVAITASQEGDIFHFPASEIISYANVNLVSGEEHVTLGEKFVTLFPNPCASETVHLSGNDITQVEIFSTLGHKVHYSNHNHSQIVRVDVSELPTGWYIVRVLNAQMAQQLTLIVQR